MTYYIWWLNQEQSEASLEGIDELPNYLHDQLRSRYGRPGRGRLWVDSCLPQGIKVDPWPDTELAHELERGYGGIVFKALHLKLLLEKPGVITDLKLNRIENIP